MDNDFWSGNMLMIVIGVIFVCFVISGALYWAEYYIKITRRIAVENLAAQADISLAQLKAAMDGWVVHYRTPVPVDVLRRYTTYKIIIDANVERENAVILRRVIADIKQDLADITITVK